MGINKRNPNTLSRVAVQRSDILDQEEEFGELRKTSSVMSGNPDKFRNNVFDIKIVKYSKLKSIIF